MGTISSKACSIEDDSKSIEEFLAAAKFGRWNVVLSILGTPQSIGKRYLISCIPEDRRWGILHQAVWFNNVQTVKKLLSFNTCDVSMKAKDGMSEVGHTGGNTAWDIAKKFGYNEIAQLLEKRECNLEAQELPTLHVIKKDVENEGLGLLRITIAAYKTTFHPLPVNATKTLSQLMNDIFDHVNASENWQTARDRISQSVYVFCKEDSRAIQRSKTKREFYQTIVRVYSDENTQLYTYVNTAMRRQRESKYRPTADDLALGPYILMFTLLLLRWNELSPETNTTYRRMRVERADAQKYRTGTKFTWYSFASSSVEEAKAVPFPTCGPSGDQTIMFIIDNSNGGQWKPRNIEAYSMYVERERVYPPGAEFSVTDRSVNDGLTTIRLKLLN